MTGMWTVGIYQPYYGHNITGDNTNPTTVEDRRKSIVGWIAVNLLLDQMLSEVLHSYQLDDNMDVGVTFIPQSNDPQQYNTCLFIALIFIDEILG